MAPGYVIALLCETAGLVGIGLALHVMRAERRARQDELRSFLRSGHAAGATPGPGAPGRAPRPDSLPVTPLRPRDPAGAASAARSALDRAVAA